MTMSESGPWSLGVLIGGPITLLILIALLTLAILCFAVRDHRTGKRYVGGGLGFLAGFLVVAVVACTPWGFWPFDAEYHQWRDVEGTVSTIDKRLIGTEGAMEDKFVVRYEGSEMQFGCDDTRCASVREGDMLALSCKRVWQYTGTDGYNCRFVATERPS